jgi:hypothetical protein
MPSETQTRMPPDNRLPQRPPQRKTIYSSANRFDFDMDRKPPHMEYKWARKTLGGQEDTENMIMTEMNCWTPVPASRHPELAGRGAKDSDSIVRGGLMLVEQPIEYAKESRDLDKFEAKNHLETQIQRLGLQARRNGARGISRTVEPITEMVE